MTRRLLINAVHEEENRVAIIENDKLIELDIEWSEQVQLKGNIYKAPITRIEPSLQAAFLDIGSSRNGFLQINDIHPAYFNNWNSQQGGRYHRPAIQDVLKAGQELIVQVVKDERQAKGATLTTNLSIPGRYLVLMVGNQRGGVSRKIVDAGQRKRLRQAVDGLRIPAGMGVIVRTAGINKTTNELQRDIDSLLDTWNQIVEKSLTSGGSQVLYRESDLAIRTIRDYLTTDIDEVLIDEKTIYEKAFSFISKVMPKYLNRLKFYEDPQPLFSKFLLDAQIDTINHPEVVLPSGGSIVINTTEAIVAVDVNSGRSTSKSDVEETAFATNKEAAYEIARQLRLRDLGGLVVIDFIDMADRRHKQIIEKTMKDAVKNDRAKVEVSRISKFGLLELSRQRLKTSLISQSHSVCPHCDGRGRIKNSEVVALEALRKIQSSFFSGGILAIKVRMSPSPALYLLNNKRHVLTELENKCGASILVFADGRLKPDQYELELTAGKSDYIPVTQPPQIAPVNKREELEDAAEEGAENKQNYDEPPRRRRPQQRQNDRRPQQHRRNNYRQTQDRDDNRHHSNARHPRGRYSNNRHQNRPYDPNRRPRRNTGPRADEQQKHDSEPQNENLTPATNGDDQGEK